MTNSPWSEIPRISTSKQRQVSWLMDPRAVTAFPTFVSDMSVVTRSPNTVTGSYRIRTCFPFDPRGAAKMIAGTRPQAPQFYIQFSNYISPARALVKS